MKRVSLTCQGLHFVHIASVSEEGQTLVCSAEESITTHMVCGSLVLYSFRCAPRICYPLSPLFESVEMIISI